MSKANQTFVQADEAVSPVIGVILMVAITVVLAAVVFVLVSNLSKTSGKAPDVSFATDDNLDRITMIKGPTGIDWSGFKLKGTFPSGAVVNYDFNTDASSADSDLSGAYVAMAPAVFNAGDFIDFCGTAAVTGTTTIQILHTESNTVVFQTSLVGIGAC